MRYLVALLLLTLVSFGAPAQAQPTDDQLGLDAHFFLILFPELRDMPAPAFLTPGLRVTYSNLASVGAAGAAISQNDVVAANGREVLVFQHAYTDIGSGVVPLYSGPVIGRPGVGAFWVNPQVLVNAERVAGNGMSVTRYAKQIGGATVNVVRFQSDVDNSRQAYEFDSATGLMTFSSFTSGTSVTQLWLMSVRGLDIPWTPSRAPNWVRPGATNEYSGTYTTDIQGAGSYSQRLTLSFVLQACGARWSFYQRQSALDGATPDSLISLSGEAQLVGALWLPRSALTINATAEGALVDEDPHTGARIFIARNELGIILQQQTSGSTTTMIYDPTSGVLLRSIQQQQSGVAVVTVDVSRTGGSDLAALAAQPEGPDDPAFTPGGNDPGGNDPGGNDPGGNDPGGNDPGGNQPGGNLPGGNQPGGNLPGGNQPGGNQPGINTPQTGGGGRSTAGCEGGSTTLVPLLLGLLFVLGRRVRTAFGK